MVGDYTKQRYLASMEGALFSGKLGAKAIVEVGASAVSRVPVAASWQRPTWEPRLQDDLSGSHSQEATARTPPAESMAVRAR